MSRDFNSTNSTTPNLSRLFYRGKWETEAYPENNGLGPNMVKNTNFLERVHYGLIDHQNNSIIPNENFIVSTANGRVFDFVADAYSLMRLNFTTAVQRGLVSTEGSAFGNLDMVRSYKNPRLRYGEYLGNILRFYNNTHIPNVLGITSIQSYEGYVNNFFDFFEKNYSDVALTMTRWNTSIHSSILDTGLAFQYTDIGFDQDQTKIDRIIDHPSFGYIKNIAMNMGFSILHNTPQIFLYDIQSPANRSIRSNYRLYNLEFLFNNRFIKTYTIDLDVLFNNINIYYNKYAQKNSVLRKDSIKCGRPHTTYSTIQTESTNTRIYSDLEELHLYAQIRNVEEGIPFSPAKIENIYKRSKFLLKTLDKAEGMSYINSIFRDQLWNKDFGYDDLAKQLNGKTTTKSQRDLSGEDPFGGSY